MYIQKVGLNTFNKQNVIAQKPQSRLENDNKSVQSVQGFCYRPIFSNQVSFKGAYQLGRTACQNVDEVQKELQALLTPMKKDFMVMKKGAIVDSFNQFYEVEYGKMAMVIQPDAKFVFKEFTEPSLKGEQFSIRVVDLKKGEFDFGYFDEKDNLQRFKVKNKQFYSVDAPDEPIPYTQVLKLKLEDKFNEMMPAIIQGVEKLDNVLNGVFNRDAKGYSMFLARGIKKRYNALNEILDGIESEKRFALKRSYSKSIPFPNKTVFFFRENDRMFADRLAFIPHRDGEEQMFRMVKYDSDSNIQDAYLIDIKDGVFKNFCKRKIFNIANISATPDNPKKMTSEEVRSTNLIPMLEKYYVLLDDFSQYVHGNSHKSAKVLLEQANAKDYLAYNMVKQNFVDRLQYILPEGEKELKFIGSDGLERQLRKVEIEDINVIEISRISEKGKVSAFINEDTCKIIDVTSSGKIVRDSHGEIRQVPYSSDSFVVRSRVLQDFIDEAFKQKTFIKDEGVFNQMQELAEVFKNISEKWFGTYSNKKTEARKLYGESFIAAKGDIGGLRFGIIDKDYAVALKPHQTGKDKFMRLTVYDKNGEIINNFLIDEFSKVVDNYCAQGKFTKDAISRVPEKIIYKTDEQLKDSGFIQYMEEYLTELKHFSAFFNDFMNPKIAEEV